MRSRRSGLLPLADRGPLRVLFALTSMPVGGAETLLVNLCRGLDRERCSPEIVCLKEPGPLGEVLAAEFPVHARLLRGKWDVRVLGRLRRLIRSRRVDALITVGAGDKMFWGRLAAWLEGVPVIASALHSTGWPDGVGRLNRWLTPVTDAFIAVAAKHGEYLVQHERFPAPKVRVIPNGVDTQRFQPSRERGAAIRQELGVPLDAPVVGIVAALRPEKNHAMFLRTAARLRESLPASWFWIVGDGPERPGLERLVRELGIADRVRFLGARNDIPDVLRALDVFTLTSHNEANPVSILEALACEVPVVATRVGSVGETVLEGVTGHLVEPGDCEALEARWLGLLTNEVRCRELGGAGRRLVVGQWSLDQMVLGYQQLVEEIYTSKCQPRGNSWPGNATCSATRLPEQYPIPVAGRRFPPESGEHRPDSRR